MARVELDELHLRVRFDRAEKVFGLVGDLTVPRSSVRTVTVTRDGRRHVHGWRVGTWVPGVLTLGVYRRHGHKQLVDVRRGRPCLVVGLDGEPYDELLVSADDAERVGHELARTI